MSSLIHPTKNDDDGPSVWCKLEGMGHALLRDVLIGAKKRKMGPGQVHWLELVITNSAGGSEALMAGPRPGGAPGGGALGGGALGGLDPDDPALLSLQVRYAVLLLLLPPTSGTVTIDSTLLHTDPRDTTPTQPNPLGRTPPLSSGRWAR